MRLSTNVGYCSTQYYQSRKSVNNVFARVTDERLFLECTHSDWVQPMVCHVAVIYSYVTGYRWIPSQRANNSDSVSMSWRLMNIEWISSVYRPRGATPARRSVDHKPAASVKTLLQQEQSILDPLCLSEPSYPAADFNRSCSLQWRYNDHDGVSNHQPHGLLDRLFRRRSRRHQSSASLAFAWGIHRDRWIPRTKGQLRGKCFRLMTSSWW